MATRQGPAADVRADPRAAQKRRTRRDLLAAAAEVMADGRLPTLAEVAERAGVSRATVYRYYPTPESVVAEVAMNAASGPLAQTARDAAQVSDPVEHAGLLARHTAAWALQHEAGLRTILRVSLDPDSGLQRPGQRRDWIADLLAPLEQRVEPAALQRLAAALTLVLGIDSIVCLKDIAGLDSSGVEETLAWVARTLVAAVLADEGPSGAEAGGRPPE